MLGALQSSSTFEALARGQFGVAVREIEEKLGEVARRPVAQRCHEHISMVLKRHIESGAPAKLVQHYEGKDWTWDFVQMGETVFPMRSRKKDWKSPAELQLLPPLNEARVDWKGWDKDGLKGLYGKDFESIDRITLYREQGPTTHIRFKDSEPDFDRSYAWALWEASAGVLRRATQAAEAKVPKKAFDPVLEQDVIVGRPDAHGKVGRAIIESMGKKNIPFTQGPQPADDLLAAFSWNGKPVVLTSQKPIKRDDGTTEHPPVRLFALEKLNGQQVWTEIPGPRGVELPVAGVSAVLEGNTVHLVGGTGSDGDPKNTHYSYDLGAASRDRHRASHWNVERPLDENVAWVSAAATERELFLSGGVAGFYVKEAGKNPEKMMKTRRDLRVYTRANRSQRDALPIEDRGGSAIAGHGVVFVGPGAAKSSRVFAYDMNKNGTLTELPRLPGNSGFGQLMYEGKTRLLYFGGERDGVVSKDIYELDLADIQGEWKKIGESDFAQGPTRVVDAYGHPMALMIRDGNAACFHLDLGAK